MWKTVCPTMKVVFEVSTESEGPDFDQTRRPFTNGHGLQFLLEDHDNDDKSKTEEQEDAISAEDTSKATHVTHVTGEVGEITEEETLHTDEEEDDEDTSQEDIEIEEKEGSQEINDELVSTRPQEAEIEESEKTKEKHHKTEHLAGDEIEISEADNNENKKEEEDNGRREELADETENKKDQIRNEDIVAEESSDPVLAEKKSARTALFSQIKSKYQRMSTIKPTQRPKRETHYKLPPAPILSPLSFDILPDALKNLILKSASNQTPSLDEQTESTNFKEEEFKEELEEKIQDMISSLRPQHDVDYVSDEDDDDDEEDEKKEPRTYGMNLTMGKGYVWNDLLSEPGTPGMFITIGEPDNLEEYKDTVDKPSLPETPTSEEHHNNQPVVDVVHPTESRPIKVDEFKETPTESNKDNLEEHKDHTVDEPTLPETPTSEEHHDYKPVVDVVHPTESRPIKVEFNETPTASNKDNLEEQKDHTVDEANTLAHDEFDKKDKSSKKGSHHPHNTEKPDLLQDLMDNEQFWKWLGEWTATYMELLMKHIKNMVHDEVGRQMKKYAINIQKDTPFETSKANNTNTDNTIAFKEKEDGEKDNKEPRPDKNATKDGKLDGQNNENKLVIDGKEIPITHTTNFNVSNNANEVKLAISEKPNENRDVDLVDVKEDLLRHKKDKDNKKEVTSTNDNSNVVKPLINVSAANIFGNAAGSESVTNIFLFLQPKNNDNEALNIIKPFINATENVFTFENRNKNTQDSPINKDENTMTEESHLDAMKETDIEKRQKDENIAKNDKESSPLTEKVKEPQIELTTTIKSEIETTTETNDNEAEFTSAQEKETSPQTDKVSEPQIDLPSIPKNEIEATTENNLNKEAVITLAQETDSNIEKTNENDVKELPNTTAANVEITGITTEASTEPTKHLDEEKPVEHKQEQEENKKEELDSQQIGGTELQNKSESELKNKITKDIEKEKGDKISGIDKEKEDVVLKA